MSRFEHAQSEVLEIADSYQSVTAFPSEWRKYLPSDATSAHWYDEAALVKLVFHEVAHARRGGVDKLLRDFVREFKGLSSTQKAKAVTDSLPHIKRLSDFDERRDDVAALLAAMQAHSDPPKPDTLGAVGREYMRSRLEAWHDTMPDTFEYERRKGADGGVPFVVEAASVWTRKPGEVYMGVNFSPPFGDPFAETYLECKDINGYSVAGFLYTARAGTVGRYRSPDYHVPCAIAVHVTSPVFAFLDRAKSRVSLNQHRELTAALANVLWSVTHRIHKESKRREKGKVRDTRAAAKQERKASLTMKAAVFEVLPAAWSHATGNGQYPVSARNLYYAVRPLIQGLVGQGKDGNQQELDYSYFSQTLLPRYQADTRKPLEGIYYEPRGTLREPHTGAEVLLGTREVETYDFPEYTYNKILYCEKQGLWPILSAARIAERYDMAVVAAQGYATEAARVLFEKADTRESYQLFVLHDADPFGYNIALTLTEETQRMPGYQVDVIDLGLNLKEALDMGLQTETFTREKKLPSRLQLSDLEREYFVGKRISEKAWRCRRVELNAMTAPQTVEYIERKLEAEGALGKVIPPDRRLSSEAQQAFAGMLDEYVDEWVVRLLGLEGIKAALRDEFRDMIPRDLRTAIDTTFGEDVSRSWRAAVGERVRQELDRRQDSLKARVRQSILDAVTDTRI
ncbi:MAG: ATP-binding protein [Chloroflexi bacterium]|nr:MAG: ATP-binding protein [Chloroflexota bacterium]